MGKGGLPNIAYNHTTKCQVHQILEGKVVVLPQSDKPLNKKALTEKISGLQARVDSLKIQLEQMDLSRNTHGSKNFRGKKVTLGEQLERMICQLDFLKQIRESYFSKLLTFDKDKGWHKF